MALNSHLRTNNGVPSHVDVHPSAHPLYCLRIPWCISSTILITIDNIQIQHVDVQRCTSRCRVITRVRVEGRDHGGLGLRSRGGGIGHGSEALHKKRKNEQEEDGGKMLNKIY